MSYVLLDRFRGMFIGVAVAEALSTRLNNVQETGEGPIALASNPSTAIATQARAILQNRPTSVISDPLALLPIALYYHDNPRQYQAQIAQVLPPASHDLATAAQVIGHGITAALDLEVTPQTVISSITAALDLSPGYPLNTIQTLLQQRANLATTVQALASNPLTLQTQIAMAYYCWLSTPTLFSLCIQRAQRIPNVQPLTLALTGALAGTTVGLSGIPHQWLFNIHREHSISASLPHTLEQWINLSDSLLAHWAGCPNRSSLPLTALAAPGKLRPGSS